ncbi:S28 family serine protease [Gaoshiqia sp. Z1-71]|uniref:S28 family serine protease n=1 Tax=Gaoshiqia hydrogeniformans TaxID=3290090 RepID=UPI003BF8102A
MLRYRCLLLTLLLALFLVAPTNGQDLKHFLKSNPAIAEVKEIEGNPSFNQTYEIKIRQPINHKDSSDGFFLQRVFVADKDPVRPVVFITEGYSAEYASQPNYRHELSQILEANQFCVEHRYFGESVPDSMVWKFLTVGNAALDHHRIVSIFKEYYQGKWLNTGISKGGQTALAHRAFFPDDVDLTIAYVAPLNFGVEDGRHEAFLKQTGTAESRSKILNFQFEILKRKAQMLPLLSAYSESRRYTYPVGTEEVLDFVVLEYPFAFWQWGYSCHEIPDLSADDQSLFRHLVKISPPDYFSYEGSAGYSPFFYQAARELGYYGYDTQPFGDLISVKSAEGYLNRMMVPGHQQVQYNPATALMISDFLLHEAKGVILIYGEIDPWTASAATLRRNRQNMSVIKPEGCHKTRILNLPEKDRDKVVARIKKVLNE